MNGRTRRDEGSDRGARRPIRTDLEDGWSAFLRRNERRLAATYAAGLGLVILVLALPPSRDAVLSRVEGVFSAQERRWIQRIERGEGLLAAGRLEEAIEHLTDLDRRFPARTSRHALDKGRERVLHALARSHEEAGNKRLALETYRRAVAFDPRNFWNHFTLARAALALDEPDEARLHLGHVLDMHPSHLPSLRQLVALQYDDGDFEAVVASYERYLDGFQVQEIAFRAGESAETVPVRVDGRYREVRVAFAEPARGPRSLELETGPVSADVGRVSLDPPLEAGRLGVPGAELRPPDEAPWSVAGTLPAELDDRPLQAPAVPPWAPRVVLLRPGEVPSPELLPTTPAPARLSVPLADPPAAIAAARIELRLRKPVDPLTWAMVETSYLRSLAFDALADARERSARLEPGGADDR